MKPLRIRPRPAFPTIALPAQTVLLMHVCLFLNHQTACAAAATATATAADDPTSRTSSSSHLLRHRPLSEHPPQTQPHEEDDQLPFYQEHRSSPQPSQPQHARQQRRQTASTTTRIVNGQDAEGSTDYPFFAQWFRGCGATLIHPDIALTAAHCYADNYQDHKLKLEGDTPATTGGGSLHSVVDAQIHPSFNSVNNFINNNEYDFMVIRLAELVPTVRPVPIHTNDSVPLQDAEELVIVGYGLTSEKGTVASTLQEATVHYHYDCSWASYRPGRLQHNTMFCASGYHNETTSIDSCQGDSGGPILRKTPQGWMQVGVTSWGVGCARPDLPGIYARTKAASQWIQSQVCAMSRAPPPNCVSLHQQEKESDSNSTDPYITGIALSATTEHSNFSAATQEQPKVTTRVSLRVDVQYDSFPQEITWALAKQDAADQKHPNQMTLLHVSPRQSTAVKNKFVSQDIIDVDTGTSYRLDVYDTISGDGIQQPAQATEDDAVAIQLWQIATTISTSSRWSVSDNATIAVIEESQSEYQLLWSHSGDFGEFVRADVRVD